jgi:hypothetical protein
MNVRRLLPEVFERMPRPGRNFGRLGDHETSADGDMRCRRELYGCARIRRPPSDADATFLNDLKTEGVSFKDSSTAITVAKDVCDLVDKGTPDTEIVKTLQAQNPQFTGNGAAKFTLVAAASYCPKCLTGEGRPPKPTGAPGN